MLVEFTGKSQLRKLGTKSFAATALREFCLPKRVTSVGNDVFLKCDQLNMIWTDGTCSEDIENSLGRFAILIPLQTYVIDNTLRHYRA